MMRINARLSDELARKLDAIERATGKTASEVMRAALERYYEDVCGRATTSREAILASGLVGCGEADPELSERCKEALTEGLETKLGHR